MAKPRACGQPLIRQKRRSRFGSAAFSRVCENGLPLTVAAAPACADTAHASRRRRTPQPRRAGVIAARAADVPRAKRILVADRLREKREGEKFILLLMISFK